MSSEKPRVGIAGYGLAGRYFHAPILAAAGFEIDSVLTKNPNRISELHSDFPSARAVGTIEELVKSKIDLLVIATSNDVHAEQAISGLNAKIPVVVDKPMGRDLKETKKILASAQSNQTPVTVYFNRLWDSDSLTIKKAIADNVIGKVFRLESRFERFRPELSANSWRENWSSEKGGGNLLDLQPHLVSTAIDWFGPAELVNASVRSIRGGSDDDIVLTLKHENGVDSYLSASAIIGSPGPKIRLSGDRGSLVINDLDPQEPMLRAGQKPTADGWPKGAKTDAQVFTGEQSKSYPSESGNYVKFYQLVKAGLQTGIMPISTEMILQVAKIIDKAREISIR
jgi:scyllo-inositol 2-dehydrogenase (NADP+)